MCVCLVIVVSGQCVELCEIVFWDKVLEFLEILLLVIVFCLKQDEYVLDESFDIMLWVFWLNDLEDWFVFGEGNLDGMLDLVVKCDGLFKWYFDWYKYDSCYDDVDRLIEWVGVFWFIEEFNEWFYLGGWLFGICLSFVDFVIFFFVCQFVNMDWVWFDGQDWDYVKSWLMVFEGLVKYLVIMDKYVKWQVGDRLVLFFDNG